MHMHYEHDKPLKPRRLAHAAHPAAGGGPSSLFSASKRTVFGIVANESRVTASGRRNKRGEMPVGAGRHARYGIQFDAKSDACTQALHPLTSHWKYTLLSCRHEVFR